MGGMDGFGRIIVKEDEPIFDSRWEATVHALVQIMVGEVFHAEEHRYAIERIPAEEYLQLPYYGRGLVATETVLMERGLVTQAELTAGHAAGPESGVRVRHDGPPPLTPRFRPGDRVRTLNVHPRGHTRLPRYARAKRGVVRRVVGQFLMPDANVYQVDAPWQACYAVEFSAEELWGVGVNSADRVCVDVWEGHLVEDEGV